MKRTLTTVILIIGFSHSLAHATTTYDGSGSGSNDNGYNTPYSTYSASLLATLPPSNGTIQLTMPTGTSGANAFPSQMSMTGQAPPPAAPPTAGSVSAASMGATSMSTTPFTSSFVAVPTQTATLSSHTYTTTESSSVGAGEASSTGVTSFGTTSATEPEKSALYGSGGSDTSGYDYEDYSASSSSGSPTTGSGTGEKVY